MPSAIRTHITAFVALAAFGWTSHAQAHDYGGYQGTGGMTAYDIDSNAYRYHYDHGFTGVDAMGWDENLQFLWSRIAAAKRCAVTMDEAAAISLLIKEYGQKRLMHQLVGVDFHWLQQRKIDDFCTQARIDEIDQVILAFSSGKIFKAF